jgi:hypothetical protein
MAQHGWYDSRSPWPVPPRNTSAVSPFAKGEIDVHWDNPSLLHGNGLATLIEVLIVG